MMKYWYMTIKLDPADFFIFDLDDTLFSEIEFLRSAYRSIASLLLPYVELDIFEEMWNRYKGKENVFQWVIDRFGSNLPGMTVDKLLLHYREHQPQISLATGAKEFLRKLKDKSIPVALITDGRSITQRNKIKALGIGEILSDIIISEEFGSAKPHPANFLFFSDKYPGHRFYFVGDNTAKDFIVPAHLGWITICIRDSGKNIHPQQFDRHPVPDYIVNSFKDIILQ